ncbi:unnamed protein product [Spirodela intermedia]|uniref:Uncharacterized protein n=1 Tax=Spirodela intermedia TaxID=51605 RepID=A0A7I8KI09_SPIIN|nr:unnamed protein product [Spirodela intermedia]
MFNARELCLFFYICRRLVLFCHMVRP